MSQNGTEQGISKPVFRNFGGEYQLRLESAADLACAVDLDEARWACSSAPIADFACDEAFLAFLDTDGNGRVRTDEVKDAIRWTLARLRNPERLSERSESLPLDEIDTGGPEGEAILAAARRVLANLGKAEACDISLDQVRNQKKIMASAANNGDGIIPASAAPDEETARYIGDVAATIGARTDACGEAGIGREELDAFEAEARAYLAWLERGRLPEAGGTSEVHPWGEATAGAAATVAALDEKVLEYFTLCDLLQFDPRAADRLRLGDTEIEELDYGDRVAVAERLRRAPVAPPTAEDTLDLAGPINAAYETEVAHLREDIAPRILGEEGARRLTRGDWEQVRGVFAAHRAWADGKAGVRVESLGRERLEECLAGPFRGRVDEMIAADFAVAGELDRISAVEKLILYRRWLLEFANNMVSLPRLYDPERRSMFERGTLIIDGRALSFAVGVSDRKQHRALAENSFMYVLYLEVTGRVGQGAEERFEVSAAVTSGESTGLYVGKRGVFFTPEGREWDARVVDIIVNPVSLGEAARAPFYKLGDFIMKQVEKFSKAQQSRVEGAVAAPAGSAATRDLLLAGSVGLAALGSSFAYITKAMKEVHLHHVLIVIVGILVAIAGPSVAIAWFRLRKRDLTALLEASGWAVNVRIYVRGRLGRLFTHEPDLPRGAVRERTDLVARFARDVGKRRVNWTRVALVCLASAAIIFGGTLWYLQKSLRAPALDDAPSRPPAAQTAPQAPSGQ